MIPHEIFKKIRKIELRPNRIVTASVERGCVQSTSRSTSAIFNALTNHHALRLGLPPSLRFGATGRPQPRSVSVSRNSKPLEFETFRNYGEFAIIRNQAGEAPPVLIPSNSTELEFQASATQRN